MGSGSGLLAEALKTYLNTIEDAFGSECDFAQLHRVYRAPIGKRDAPLPGEPVTIPCPQRLSDGGKGIGVQWRRLLGAQTEIRDKKLEGKPLVLTSRESPRPCQRSDF